LQSTVTPLVEGYGGYALRFEVVPIESAYPGFGELVVHLPLTHCWFLFASSYWVCVDVTIVKECGYAVGRQTEAFFLKRSCKTCVGGGVGS
jgi:hypothetical protein